VTLFEESSVRRARREAFAAVLRLRQRADAFDIAADRATDANVRKRLQGLALIYRGQALRIEADAEVAGD
jgi:hypothetical protein